MALNYRELLFSGGDYTLVLFENDFVAVFPELFLLAAGLSLLMYGAIYSTSQERNYPYLILNISWLAVVVLIFTLVLIINNPIKNGSVFFNSLVLDELTFFFKIVIVCSALFSLLIMHKQSVNQFESCILFIIGTGSSLLLISSADFISLYLAIELQSLCFYVLAGIKRTSEFSTEAGLKYFLLGAFSSGLLVFGCSLIYGFTGITNFSDCGRLFACGTDLFSSTASTYFQNPVRGCQLGMIFVCIGFLFKSTAAPFHQWAPDVYQGASTSVTAFFAITPKAGIFAVFIRVFLESFYDFLIPAQKMLIFSSLASLLCGGLAAMAQKRIKRFLAFSSIGHVGFILIGLCCATIQGVQALLIYLVIYIVMTISLFSIVLSPVRRETSNSVKRVLYITDLAYLAKTNPLLASTLALTLFSTAGIPPLAGFYSKAFLFFAAMSSTIYLLAGVGVFTSVLSCFYYIRIIKIMYFEKPTSWCSFSRIGAGCSFALGICLFFTLFFITYPSPLYLITHKVALSFCF